MKTHITPIQLYFLTFSYLLSGFYLYHIDSFFAVAAQFSVFFIFAVLATGGAAGFLICFLFILRALPVLLLRESFLSCQHFR